MRLIKGIGMSLLCLITLVGCSNTHIEESFGSYYIARTEEMDSKRIKQNNILQLNEVGKRHQEAFNSLKAKGIEIYRTYPSRSTLNNSYNIYVNQVGHKLMVEALQSEKLKQYIEQSREEQRNEIIIKSEIVDGYAVSYNNDPYGNKLKEHLSVSVIKQYLQGVETPELVIAAPEKDIVDPAYQTIVDLIKTEDFLVKEVLVEGKTDCIMLTNALASAETSPIYVDKKFIDKNKVKYIVPASVRYEVYLQDMTIQKVKVYMIKQEDNPIDLKELGPIYKLQEAVDKDNSWEQEIEAIYTTINKDKQKQIKGKLGKWKYTCKVMDKDNKDYPVEQNFIEITIEP